MLSPAASGPVLLLKARLLIDKSTAAFSEMTSLDSGSGAWSKLHDRYYRRIECYTMQWEDIDLSKMVVAGARFGGPVATIRDEGKLVRLGAEAAQPILKIFSASGRLLSAIKWTESRIVAMAWSDSEQLVVVLRSGSVCVYSMHGELLNLFSIGLMQDEVESAVIWGTGLAVLTTRYQLYTVENLTQPLPVQLKNPGLTSPPHCMAVVEPNYTASHHVEVLLAVGSSIVVVDADSVQDQQLTNGPFATMSVCPNGKFIACFCRSGNVWVASIDFSRNLSDFTTKSQLPPSQLVWCGLDSVVLYWPSLLLMVGPYGDWVKYNYDEPLALIPDIDSIRVVSNSKTDILQRVPDCIVDVFKIGSIAPSAMLFDAMELYQKEDAKSDENMRCIKKEGKLLEAVQSCIEAASHEFSPESQSRLLRAASYGKCFLDDFNSDSFVETAKTLRVLNAVRSMEVGMPVTYKQYEGLSFSILVNRLVLRKQHLLAIKLSKYMGVRYDKVVVHWGCQKVKSASSQSDEVVRDMVISRVSQCAGVSCAQIAATAYQAGREKLAKLILDEEPRASDQIPLLIDMKDESAALAKALACGDTNLVFLTIMHVLDTQTSKGNRAKLFDLLAERPGALDLFILFARSRIHRDDIYFDLTFELRQHAESGNTRLLQALRASDLASKQLSLVECLKDFKKVKDSENGKIVEEEMKLLTLQKEFDGDAGPRVPSCVGKPLSDTIMQAYRDNDAKRAIKLIKEFKVSDKRAAWLKLRGLAAGNRWEDLLAFANEKKSPIGYEPFVEVCMSRSNFSAAESYCEKVTDHSRRSQLYLGLNKLNEAADAAALANDGELLSNVRARAKDQSTIDYIDALAVKAGFQPASDR